MNGEKVEQIIGKKVSKVEKLHGDASYREYFRADLKDGGSVIIMQMPVGKSSVSEEITNYKGEHKEIPFINVQKFLVSCGLPVPKILEYSETERVIVLEDLGDEVFIKQVTGGDAVQKETLYKKALDLLVMFQEKTSGAIGDCVAKKRSFDEVLLNWEFDHFREYLIENRPEKKMEGRDKVFFEKITREITKKIARMPKIFTHRDFQSKNLILSKNGELSLIDFQDALMGPYVYDLVALLRDSYVEVEGTLLDRLIGYYADKKGIKDIGRLKRDFDLVTLQRKMKDAGRFVYIDRVKKNPNFLQYIPTTLKYVRQALMRESKDLLEMLKKYVAEFR